MFASVRVFDQGKEWAEVGKWEKVIRGDSRVCRIIKKTCRRISNESAGGCRRLEQTYRQTCLLPDRHGRTR